MNVARFIARRYFKTKKSRNVIHLITNISVVGIAVSTAALVILLSAFNGIEQVVINLYSDFDADIIIRSNQSKTFDQNSVDFAQLQSIDGVQEVCRSVEEIVILKNNEKWAYAEMVGIDTNFLTSSKMKDHIVDGIPVLYLEEEPQAIIGATLLDKLDGYIRPEGEGQQWITLNVPLREGKIKPGANPFNVQKIPIAARMNFNKEVNAEKIVLPYDLAKNLLAYQNDITAIYVDVQQTAVVEKVKTRLQQVLGDDFSVKTNMEKNELIFKTSQSERLIVYFILVFVFLLASFNLIASIAMLIVEKKQDIFTLSALGTPRQTIFNIFFFEGILIVGKGILWGLALGYLVVFSQVYFGLIQIPNFPGGVFPIKVTFLDGLWIFVSVAFLGFIVSYFPTKLMMNRMQALKNKKR